MRTYNCIGVMSGSSLDGLDLVLVEFSEGTTVAWKVLKSKCYSLAQLKARLSQSYHLTVKDLAILEAEFSEYVAQCIADLVGDEEVLCAGVHGHTILHLPQNKVSWQLLSGGLVAEKTDITTVCDFRNQDLAWGGVGTPMAVIADRDLFPNYNYYINLGGIANISFEKDGKWTAYDLFPCNQVFNHYAQQLGQDYDEDGVLSKLGKVHEGLLRTLLQDNYLTMSPPKSIDNQWIKDHWLKMIDDFDISPQDKLRTHLECMLVHLKSVFTNSDSKVLLSGGGTYHKYLIDKLREEFPRVEFVVPDKLVIDYKESILMAYLAYLRVQGKLNFIPSATGAVRAVSAGAVYGKKAP